MKFFVVLALTFVACNAFVSSTNTILILILNYYYVFFFQLQKRAANGDQDPKIWDALKVLRGGKDLTVADQQEIYAKAVAGVDYPNNLVIPDSDIKCSDYAQPGFYADTSSPSKCQIFHRCDDNGIRRDFICPAKTVSEKLRISN